MKKICRNCQYWNIHSLDMKMGDCMAPDDHRYWHVPITSPKTGKTSIAMMDSFGREETKPDFGCAAWKNEPMAPSPQATVFDAQKEG